MTARRILLGAFGDPGHAFPIIALGRELARRGHDVTLQTWVKWQSQVEAGGQPGEQKRARIMPAYEMGARRPRTTEGRSLWG